MANATDIITYIGIPLAVLGVLPLLWNMAKSFIIRYRLLSSLPMHLRSRYSLIMDPAAGSVSVSVDTPRLDLVSFWLPIQPLFLCHRVSPHSQNDLLGESWMDLTAVGILPQYTGPRKRFVVESDLRVQPVSLRCSWESFVRLSLALGVDAYSGGLLDLRRHISSSFKDISLKHSGGSPLMNVQNRENRITAKILPPYAEFSLRRGLAWDCRMVVAQDMNVHVISPRKKIWDPDFPVAGAMYHLHIEKLTLPEQAMDQALIWVLYVESLYHHSSSSYDTVAQFINGFSQVDTVLPVMQGILKTREIAVEELRLMDHLEASLNETFAAEKILVNSIITTLQREWDSPPLIFENKQSARPYVEDPPGYLDIWSQIQDNDTFIALNDNYNPVPTSRTRSDADLTQLNAPMTVLARVIIALSSIQKWPRQEWSVQTDENGKRTFTVPDDPMIELLSTFDGQEPANPYGREEPSIYLE